MVPVLTVNTSLARVLPVTATVSLRADRGIVRPDGVDTGRANW